MSLLFTFFKRELNRKIVKIIINNEPMQAHMIGIIMVSLLNEATFNKF